MSVAGLARSRRPHAAARIDQPSAGARAWMIFGEVPGNGRGFGDFLTRTAFAARRSDKIPGP